MGIDNYRSGFLTIIGLALAITCLTAAALPITIASLLLIGCALVLARLSAPGVGRTLGGLALANAAVAGVVVAAERGVWQPAGLVAAGGAGGALAAGALVWGWQRRLPVRYGQQINLSSIFGWRMIRGPTRIRRPTGLLNRVISILPLRELKSDLHVSEIDTYGESGRSQGLRLVGSDTSDTAISLGPAKIHLVHLSISYRIDGDHWFLLNDIPQIERSKRELAPQFGGVQRAHEQPAFWELLLDRVVQHEVAEELRHVIHHGGWGATRVSDERETIANALLERLRALTPRYGLIFTAAELVAVAVDSPQTLRAARDTTLRGEALLSLQGSQLERLRQQLRGYFNQAEIEEILRTHAVELSYYMHQPAQLSHFLDSLLAQRRDLPHLRDAA
jgi:hypothetical protein